MTSVTQRRDLTFKHNIQHGRFGWLRLTPAYSIKVVESLIEDASTDDCVVDPFSGTGTTGLLAAREGLRCDLYELNPFLVWLAEVKTRNYDNHDRAEALKFAESLQVRYLNKPIAELWIPPMHNVERWWPPRRLRVIAEINERIEQHQRESPRGSIDLLKVAFCQTLIKWSNAAFNHQSMSFKKVEGQSLIGGEEEAIVDSFRSSVRGICDDAESSVSGTVRVFNHDSRCMEKASARDYSLLITSPPYPNRMSYIRELRPYMYWLRYLDNGRDSGEMDWESIGGTWGIATSRLTGWRPKGYLKRHVELQETVSLVSKRSPPLGNYIHKYFEDMYEHFKGLTLILRSGARVNYVIGNSKFYDVVVPTDKFYVSMLNELGFKHTESEVLRKRSSKKELFEYVVSATFER